MDIAVKELINDLSQEKQQESDKNNLPSANDNQSNPLIRLVVKDLLDSTPNNVKDTGEEDVRDDNKSDIKGKSGRNGKDIMPPES